MAFRNLYRFAEIPGFDEVKGNHPREAAVVRFRPLQMNPLDQRRIRELDSAWSHALEPKTWI